MEVERLEEQAGVVGGSSVVYEVFGVDLPLVGIVLFRLFMGDKEFCLIRLLLQLHAYDLFLAVYVRLGR